MLTKTPKIKREILREFDLMRKKLMLVEAENSEVDVFRLWLCKFFNKLNKSRKVGE